MLWQTKICNMKSVICLSIAAAMLIAVVAMPQNEGQQFTPEAIRQAQDSYLIPRDAQIQSVREGIELAAYESIPGSQRINLFEILGDQVPSEVVNNLQGKIDEIGKY